MTTTMTQLLSFCSLVALGPCSEPQPLSVLFDTGPGSVASQPETERPRERPRQQTLTTHAFMRDHAREAEEMRRATIAGRFDRIHRTSALMASDAWSANLRPDYLPHVTAIRRAAGAALDARTMPAAAAALGELGAACASCHREHGGPRAAAHAGPAKTGASGMAAHAAAERALWEGLFTPSEARWRDGARQLAEAPELFSNLKDIDELGTELRQHARQAVSSPPRADVYGNIMATCSTCHRRLSVEPR